MIKLILNEFMKIFWRKSSIVMLAVIVTVTFFSSLFMKLYNIFPGINIWDGIEGQLWIMFFLKIFTLVVAGGIIANEFSWHTIKLLLIHPVSRSKILLAKYLTVLIFALLLEILLFGSSFVVNGILYGFKDPSNSHFLGKKLTFTTFDKVLFIYGLKYIELFIYATLGFMLSVISRSSAFAIGASFLLLFLGPQLSDLLSKYTIHKYLLFTHLDLTKYIGAKETNFSGMTSSLIIITIYMVLFNITSWTVFKKRDVS